MTRRSRRRLLTEALAWASVPLVLPAGVRAVAGEERHRKLTEPAPSRRRRQSALERGCAYLATKKRPDGGYGDDKAVVALTALATLALMTGGSSPGRGPHGEPVHEGLQFLLRLIESPSSSGFTPEGYFHFSSDHDSKMHGQGYAGLALGCALGTAPEPLGRRIRAALVKAVRLMEQAQTVTGGYGYDPSRSTMHEGSVTVCIAHALRAARDGGLLVSERVVQDGLRYLKRSQTSSRGPDDGGFKYSLQQQKHSYALTAAALSSFFLYGRYVDDAERTIERGLKYLMLQLERGNTDEWYFYGHFYAAWALWQVDGADWGPGSRWGRWQASVLPDLLARQHADGSWDDDGSFGGRFVYGPVLATAFAVLTLAIPDEPLPVFQR